MASRAAEGAGYGPGCYPPYPPPAHANYSPTGNAPKSTKRPHESPGWDRNPDNNAAVVRHKGKEARRMIRDPTDVDVLPVHPYTDEFKQRTWKEMIDMLRDYGREYSPAEIEATRDESGPLLLLTSWIKDVRWYRRARAPDEEKSPKATRGRAGDGSANPTPVDTTPLPDCLTLTPERIGQLNRGNFPWRGDRTSWQKWLDDLLHYRAKNDGDANVPLKYAEVSEYCPNKK
jgi:hypothetical protein